MISVPTRPVHHSTFDDLLDYCAMDNSMLTGSSSLSNINASLESEFSSQLQTLIDAQVGGAPTAIVSIPFCAPSSTEYAQLSRLSFGSSGSDQLAHFNGGFPVTAGSAMPQSQPFLSAEHLAPYAKLQNQGPALGSRQSPISARTVAKSFQYPGMVEISSSSNSASPHRGSISSSSAFASLSPPAAGLRHGSLTTPPPAAMATMNAAVADHRSPPCTVAPATATLRHHDSTMHCMAAALSGGAASSAVLPTTTSFPCGPYSPDFPSDVSDTAPSTVGPSDVSGLEREMLHPRVLDKKESAQFRKVRSARREVKRLKLQKEAFQRLSHLLPCDTRRMSRLDLLRRTTEYIHELQLALDEQKRQVN